MHGINLFVHVHAPYKCYASGLQVVIGTSQNDCFYPPRLQGRVSSALTLYIAAGYDPSVGVLALHVASTVHLWWCLLCRSHGLGLCRFSRPQRFSQVMIMADLSWYIFCHVWCGYFCVLIKLLNSAQEQRFKPFHILCVCVFFFFFSSTHTQWHIEYPSINIHQVEFIYHHVNVYVGYLLVMPVLALQWESGRCSSINTPDVSEAVEELHSGAA